MRNIKTQQEIATFRRNGTLSATGQVRAIAAAHPGIYEFQLEAEAEYVFHSAGAQGVANPAIASSGPNVNTWHYFQDRRKTEPNDLVVLDFAADLDHMAMDITRTFNVNGKFTEEEAHWYWVELAAQKAIIEMLRPGNTYEQAYSAGKAIFDKAGVQQKLLPFPSHFVGLAQHDPLRPTGTILAGQVVTVEPILDFPDKHLLFRIEDTVLTSY
jgi:Xaa-Pro aminopeptidase